jgi:hypothetical protein
MRLCFLESAVMMVLLLVAGVLSKRGKRISAPTTGFFKIARKVCATGALIVVFSAALVAGSRTPAAIDHTAEPGCSGSPFCGIHFDWNQREWDLASGTYFVAMLNTTCSHCEESVAALNELGSLVFEDTPLVSLCVGDEKLLREFRLATQPEFPTILIDTLLFLSLIGDESPRFLIVRNGKIVRYWDSIFPKVEEVLTVLASSSE